MQAEHLPQWLIAATRHDSTDATNWMKFVSIVQVELHDETLAKECTWKTVVLIQKGKGDFQGIGLTEVLWKAVASLLNRRLTAEIIFHDMLHRFWVERGTGTATLNAKLPLQLTAMREVVLFEVLLDLWKAYNALEQERALDFIAVYGVGFRTVRLLRTYWYLLTIMAKAGG